VFTGEFVPSEQSIQQVMPMFTVGVLPGYGSRKVFVWLDSQVTRLFAIKKEKEKQKKYAKSPNLIGMAPDEAKKRLAESNFELVKGCAVPTK
jgi:hypothetical protein